MATYRFMAYSIQEEIKQTFDDASVDLNQIVYWINLIAKRARFDKIKKNRSDAYLIYFPDVNVFVDDKTKRKYATLPSTIVDLDNDFGIKTVTYCADDSDVCDEPLNYPFSRTQAGKVRTLYGNPFRKPSSKNVFFFRSKYSIDGVIKDVIFFIGLECVDITCVDMWIYADESTEYICDLDQQINISPEMEKIIYYEVLNLARYGFMIPSDKKNDGTDSSYKESGKIQAINPVYKDIDNMQQANQYNDQNIQN